MTVGDDDGQTDGVPVHLDRYFESGNFRGRENRIFQVFPVPATTAVYYSRSFNPFTAPEPLPILNPRKFVPTKRVSNCKGVGVKGKTHQSTIISIYDL